MRLTGFLLLVAAAGAGAQTTQPSVLLDPAAPVFAVRAPERCTVRLDTSQGIVDIDVTRAWAPLGADRFVALVRHGYYDGTRFFRIRS